MSSCADLTVTEAFVSRSSPGTSFQLRNFRLAPAFVLFAAEQRQPLLEQNCVFVLLGGPNSEIR